MFGNVVEVRHTELGQIYTQSYQYDAGNRLSHQNPTQWSQHTYNRDGVRRIDSVQATLNGTPTPPCPYTDSDQLINGSFEYGALSTDHWRDFNHTPGLTTNQPRQNRNPAPHWPTKAVKNWQYGYYLDIRLMHLIHVFE